MAPIPAGIVSSARVASTFTPASLPNLWGWWDASQITGLVNNDPVASWPDLSGNGRDVAQGNSSKRPVYKTGAFGALPAVLFDGTDDALVNAAAPSPGVALTVAVVVRASSLSAYRTVFGGNLKLNLGANLKWELTASGVAELPEVSVSSPTAGVSVQMSARFDTTTDAYSYRVDGATAGSGTNGTTPTTDKGVTLGQSHSGQNADYWPGHIAEVVVYSTALNDTDTATLDAYLKAKWGTP